MQPIVPSEHDCRLSDRVGLAIFVFIVGVASSPFFFMGFSAIQTQHFHIAVARGGGGGRGGSMTTNGGRMESFEGADAVRVGVGLVSLGTIVWYWCALLIWSNSRRQATEVKPSVCRLLGWLSFTCLIVVTVSFFPPWRQQSVIFWSIICFVCVEVPLLIQIRCGSWVMSLAFAATALLCVSFYCDQDRLFDGLLWAFAISEIGFLHLLILFPPLIDWINSKSRITRR